MSRVISCPLARDAAAIAANTLANSALGFLFWLIAARLYLPTEVGIGAAYISAITLLAAVAEMGLGTTLIRFASQLEDQSTNFVNSSLVFVAGSTVILTLIFIVGVNLWAPELRELAVSATNATVFALTCLLFSLAQFLDKLYIAYRAAGYMLFRNVVANLLRLGILLVVGRSWGALGLLMATGGGALLTLGLSTGLLASRVVPKYRWRFQFHWPLLRDRLNYTLANHIAQLLWSMPPLVYPLLITVVLDAQANAYFYTSWMIANLLFILPLSVATSAFAQSSASASSERRIFQNTAGLTLLGLIPIVLVMIVFSSHLLSFFGRAYAERGRELLVWLIVSIFPYTLNTFAITYLRSKSNARNLVMLSGFVAVISALAVVGFGLLYSLPGIGIGWLVGQTASSLVVVLVFWLSRLSSHPSG